MYIWIGAVNINLNKQQRLQKSKKIHIKHLDIVSKSEDLENGPVEGVRKQQDLWSTVTMTLLRESPQCLKTDISLEPEIQYDLKSSKRDSAVG